jgi:hypothetical protein
MMDTPEVGNNFMKKEGNVQMGWQITAKQSIITITV